MNIDPRHLTDGDWYFLRLRSGAVYGAVMLTHHDKRGRLSFAKDSSEQVLMVNLRDVAELYFVEL